MKNNRIPYFRQQKNYWCGPASLQMVLAAHAIRRSQAALARQAGTSARSGTPWAALKTVLRAHGFTVRTPAGSPLGLRSAVHTGEAVIVNFVEPAGEEGHYAVVTGINAGSIVLNDPWSGRGFRMSLKDFSARWKRRARRMMVIKRNPSPIG